MGMCEYCGRFDDTVETVLAPYLLEVHGEEHWVTICSVCFLAEALEI